MNSGKIAELESLLSEALPSVVIRRGDSEQLDHDAYRRTLRKCRAAYNPMLRLTVPLYCPDIGQTDLRDRVVGFVNRELADYIRDGRIHSATYAFVGGLGGGSPVEDVVRNLVRRTLVDGPAVAAQAFADCITSSSCSFYKFFLLSGIRIDASTEVFDGITLIPLPKLVSELPPHLPSILNVLEDYSRISVQHLLEKTLVRVEYEVSPIFHQPAESYTIESGPEKHFGIKMKGTEAQDFDLNVLCQALGLAGSCSVRSAMTWTSLLDYEIFDLSPSWGIGGSGYSVTIPVLRLDQSGRLTQTQFETVKTLYWELVQLPSKTQGKLRIPIDRWMKSMEQNNPIDQIIDLGIALESLYVPNAQSEVSLRFALHAAWHLGQDRAERTKLREEFQEIYAARSDVVHTGQLRGRRAKSDFNASEFVSRAQDLCRQGITSVINASGIPDWNNLVMGEDSD